MESRITSFVPNYNMDEEQVSIYASSRKSKFRSKSEANPGSKDGARYGENEVQTSDENTCTDATCILNIFEKIDNASLIQLLKTR